MTNKTSNEMNVLHRPVGRRSLLKASAGLAAFTMAGGLLTAAAHASGGLVALVHTQAAGDAGPVDSMIAKLKQLSEEQGFQYRAVYAQDPATYETIFRTLGDAGAAVIVSTFNEVAEPFKALAPSYPNTKWIQLFADPFEPAIPNVVTVSYDYYLGCYLSGIFAARVSKAGKLGFIGGVSIPPINADYNAFKAGFSPCVQTYPSPLHSRALSRTRPRARKSPRRCTRAVSTSSRPTPRQPTSASSPPQTRRKAAW